MDTLKLSKHISYALRHKPEEFGLTLAEGGWVDVDDLIEALRKRQWKALNLDMLQMIVDSDSKGRYEISDGRIRAVYGHSAKVDMDMVLTEPPHILYHGTPSRTYREHIEEEGLSHMGRQYVHLTEDRSLARTVAERRDKTNTTIIAVYAKFAHRDGIKFYQAPNGIWLSDDIPPKYIDAVQVNSYYSSTLKTVVRDIEDRKVVIGFSSDTFTKLVGEPLRSGMTNHFSHRGVRTNIHPSLYAEDPILDIEPGHFSHIPYNKEIADKIRKEGQERIRKHMEYMEFDEKNNDPKN